MAKRDQNARLWLAVARPIPGAGRPEFGDLLEESQGKTPQGDQLANTAVMQNKAHACEKELLDFFIFVKLLARPARPDPQRPRTTSDGKILAEL